MTTPRLRSFLPLLSALLLFAASSLGPAFAAAGPPGSDEPIVSYSGSNSRTPTLHGIAEPADVWFTFARYLFEDEQTLYAWVEELNPSTGYVLLNGVELGEAAGPFTWCWGDEPCTDGWFPQSHTYSDLTRNHVVKVISHYSGGGTDSVEVVVRFVAPEIDPISIPPELAVIIPDSMVDLVSRMPGYGIPEDLTWFDDGYFDIVPRSTAEYVLSAASLIQNDIANQDVCLVDGAFQEFVLRTPSFPGMYSLWYTGPVTFACGDYGFEGTIQWSSFMHEMGHNYSLNSPADYFLGGKIDGCANAICSESLAQVFQHACAFELINGYDYYGLSDDLMCDIKENAIATVKTVRTLYEDYLDDGMPFASWNDPETPEDEALGTFMTIAYKFFEHAETSGLWYLAPAKGMMEVLQTFDWDLRERYDQYNNTAEADTFRATFMVSALSYGFSTDLRDEFRDLNFPISDELFDELTARPTAAVPPFPGDPVSALWLGQNAPNPLTRTTAIDFALSKPAEVSLAVYDASGRLIRSLAKDRLNADTHTVIWDGCDQSGRPVAAGVYFYELRADKHKTSRKMMVVR